MPKQRDGYFPDQEITSLLAKWRDGEGGDALFEAVYGELRRRAKSFLRGERVGHTLQTGALVHEVYLRLVEQRHLPWANRSHFFALAARMMRRILVDHARGHRSAGRGGGRVRVPIEEAPTLAVEKCSEYLLVHEALRSLQTSNPDLAQLVELRYFGGLTSSEIGEVLGISVPTVTRRWQLARAWLFRELNGEEDG
ncbi:MAG: sigma-70 family RNA polymerase sigma factor [Deltaproteobacteria bacterium]|nr:sigma-70 family RNA polymerase sigma factor [Deltaproteobacteria bacterium]